MTDSIHEHAAAAGRAAKTAYLAGHPEPQVHDYACPRCHAEPGTACRSPFLDKVINSHCPRQARMIRARWRRRGAAIEAEDAAYNAVYDRLRRATRSASTGQSGHTMAESGR